MVDNRAYTSFLVIVLFAILSITAANALNPSLVSQDYTGSIANTFFTDTTVNLTLSNDDNETIANITITLDGNLQFQAGSDETSTAASFTESGSDLVWTNPGTLSSSFFEFTVTPSADTETTAADIITLTINGQNNSQSIDLTDFSIDTKKPTVSLDSPADSATQSGSVTFSFTPTDTNLESCTLYGDFSGTFAANTTSTPTSGSQTSTTLTLSDGTYLWNVQCNDTLGNTASNSNNFTVTIAASSRDTAPRVTSVNDSDRDGNIEITWDADPSAVKYNVYRSTSTFQDANDATLLALNLTATSFQDQTTTHDQLWFYAVTTVDSEGQENKSIINTTTGFSLNATANDTINPATVQKVRADLEDATVTLTWDAVTTDTADNNDSASIQYEVWRGTSVDTDKTFVNDSNSGFEQIDTVSATTLTDDFSSTNTFHYIVTPKDDAGNVNYTITLGSNGNYVNATFKTEEVVRPPDVTEGGRVAPDGSYTRTWDTLYEGTTEISIDSEDLAVNAISFFTNSRNNDVSLIVERLDDKGSITEDIPDLVFQYLEITTENLDDIGEVVITFILPDLWLSDNNLEKVFLYRYTTTWEKLPATKIESETYSATSPGLSIFAIAGQIREEESEAEETAEETTPEQTAEEATPDELKSTVNFQPWMVWAIVALLIIAFLYFYFFHLKKKLMEQKPF